MSHFPDLLIETYHELLDIANQLVLIEKLVLGTNNEIRIDFIAATQKKKLRDRAAAIRKRMQSLGYHTCWKDGDNIEVELP